MSHQTINGNVRETPWSRLLWSVRSAISPSLRGLTQAEYDERKRSASLARDNEALRSDVSELRIRNAEVAAALRVSNLEVAKLSEVCERDRLRVEAETAELARRVADAKNPSR